MGITGLYLLQTLLQANTTVLHRQVSSHPPTSSPQQEPFHCKENLMGQVKETTHNNCHRINIQFFHLLSPLREADEWGMGVEVSPQKLPSSNTHPHTLLHPVWHPSYWIQSLMNFSNVASFHQMRSFRKRLLHATVPTGKPVGSPP